VICSNRFSKSKTLAWERKATLTPYGELICRERFEAVEIESYEINVTEYDDVHECNVRHKAGGPMHGCTIPKEPDEHGSRFGACSCGIDKTKTIPCVHMIAATKSSKIQGLTRVNIMPSWCYTCVWREQFGEDAAMHAGIDMVYLKDNYQPNPKIRYCPSIAAAAKPGRKKNLKRAKGALERGGKRKKKDTKMKLTSMEELELGPEMFMDDGIGETKLGEAKIGGGAKMGEV